MQAETSETPKKQLIVVVHGVGIRAAGESSDLVAAALDGGTVDDDPPPQEPDGTRFRRRASDDFQLFETVAMGSDRLAATYPARLTRFRKFSGPFPDQDSPERVISDFYWGDVGGFASSAPALVVGLGRVMLGLAHVVRENALTVFPDLTSRWQAVVRGLARGAALAIHGPILAINITLLFGLGFIILLGDDTNLVSVLTAACCLALAFRLHTYSLSFLLRHMGAYLGLMGLLLLLFTALDHVAPSPVVEPEESARAERATSVLDRLKQASADEALPAQPPPDQRSAFVIPWLDAQFRSALCSWKPLLEKPAIPQDAGKISRAECNSAHMAGPFLHAMRLQGLMVMIWSGIALVTLMFGLRWLVLVVRADPRHHRDILMPTLSLMMLLWFLLIGLGWAAIAATYDKIGPGPIWATTTETATGCSWLSKLAELCGTSDPQLGLFATSLRGIWASVATLAVLILTGVIAWRYRQSVFRKLRPARYMDDPDRIAEAARLIVPGLICAALAVMPMAILWLIAASTFVPPDHCVGDATGKLACWLELNTNSFLTWIVAAVAFGIPVLLRPLSQGINVGGDVIIYLNDLHWRRHPDAVPSRTFAEVAVPALGRLRKETLPVDQGYAFRLRIQKRLHSLVADLVRTEEPDRIDFVSHSQGTVIALNVLGAEAPDWATDDRRISLITMGSPWRHLYHRYFPASFSDLTAPPPGVRRWVNIFRVDDFIGTHVRKTSPDEIAVNLGGHSNYWRDVEVKAILRRELDTTGPTETAG